MGKSRRGSDKEYSRLQQALWENKKLKREIASLRKQLARLDLDRHAYVKDIIEKSHELEDIVDGNKLLAKLKKEWACRECTAGHLEIFLYNKPEGTYYFRRCSNNACKHRTKSQKYNAEQVKGVTTSGEVLD